MKKLTLTFIDAAQKKQALTPDIFRENLTADETRSIMDEISKLELFDKDGVKKFAALDSAKYTDTIITDIF